MPEPCGCSVRPDAVTGEAQIVYCPRHAAAAALVEALRACVAAHLRDVPSAQGCKHPEVAKARALLRRLEG